MLRPELNINIKQVDMVNNVVASTSPPAKLPANNKQTNVEERNKNLKLECSYCSQVFNKRRECLKHEFLTHRSKNKTTPNSPFDRRIKAASEFLNTASKREECTKIHNALQNCPGGKELSSIIKLLYIDDDSLSNILKCIQMCLQKELSSLGVVKMYPYGSIANGLAMWDSDIDIYMDITLIPTPQNRDLQRCSFNQVDKALRRSQHFVEVFAIRQTRVPVIRCKHRDTGFDIDINVSHRSGMEKSQFIRHLMLYSDDRILEFLQILKLWAKNMHVIANANMISHCFISMAIFYLQQPWKVDGVESGKAVQILKSVKELQSNCNPQLTEGVNYAFDLQSPDNRPKIPQGVTTLELLKRFFCFYKEYNFEDNIISPFYGKSIPKVDFTRQKYETYANQLATITQYMKGVLVQPFAMDGCMCVQDPFALNQNLALPVCPAAKKYFMLCLQNADDICQSLNNSQKIGDVLEKLLYEAVVLPVIEKNNNTLIQKRVEVMNINLKALNYCMNPRKSDLNYIFNINKNLTESTEFLSYWCEHFSAAIPQLLSALYRIEVQKPQMQHLNNANLAHVWHISTTVDLWTNRFFETLNQKNFWKYQLEQTNHLYKQRRREVRFSVNLNALLNVRVLPDFGGIILSVTMVDGTSASVLSKKDPLRKFFNSVKNTLQKYGYQEALALQEYVNSNRIQARK